MESKIDITKTVIKQYNTPFLCFYINDSIKLKIDKV